MRFKITTKGYGDTLDITDQVQQLVADSQVKEGVALVFIAGSTAGITTIEHEQGIIEDIKNVFEKVCPEDFNYLHHQEWGDGNGAAHIRSAIIGTDLNVPIENGVLQLGTWQQIVLIDFDRKPREREIIVKVVDK